MPVRKPKKLSLSEKRKNWAKALTIAQKLPVKVSHTFKTQTYLEPGTPIKRVAADEKLRQKVLAALEAEEAKKGRRKIAVKGLSQYRGIVPRGETYLKLIEWARALKKASELVKEKGVRGAEKKELEKLRRREVIESLMAKELKGKKGSRAAQNVLMRLHQKRLFTSADPEVRLASLWRLYDVGGRRAAPIIEKVLLEDPKPEIRSNAVTILEAIGLKRSLKALKKAFNDSNSFVRREAVKVYKKISQA